MIYTLNLINKYDIKVLYEELYQVHIYADWRRDSNYRHDSAIYEF